jgi:hypothetical protein
MNDTSLPGRFEIFLGDTTKSSTSRNTFNYISGLSQQMGLDKLDTGIKGIGLRLWITGIMDTSLLISINIIDSVVHAQKIFYYVTADGLAHFKKKDKQFLLDSSRILDKQLAEIDFYSMITQQDIPTFVDNIGDGVFYDLEVSTSAYYKLISYHCPESFAKSEINNRQFLDFILKLDDYFHFYSFECV